MAYRASLFLDSATRRERLRNKTQHAVVVARGFAAPVAV